MSIIPSVRADLAERFIINFRMPPQTMKSFLPVEWLEPAEIGGYAVVSFCMLDLRNITVAPLPTVVGLSSLSCAPRYAVRDCSATPSRPAVFVTERYTNSAFGAWFTSLGCSAPHPYVDAAIERRDDVTRLTVNAQESKLFAADVRPATDSGDSIFDRDSFRQFIAEGVSSFGLSRYGKRLTRLNLYKQDDSYEPLEVMSCTGAAVDEWLAAGAEVDSAFRTSNGLYEWEYLGLTA